MSDFQISSEAAGGRVVVRCRGELDLAAAPEAETYLEAIEREGATEIVLDLSGIEFLDSTGLRVVVAADARARRGGHRLLVVPGPEHVHRVFRIALLDQRLEFVDDARGDRDDA